MKIMRKRSVLLSLLLVLCLVFSSVTICSAAEQTYLISSQQLTTLENNNKELTTLNNERLEQLTKLKEQVKVLQMELSNSKAALTEAQSYSEKMQQSINKLEKQVDRLRPSKIAPMVGYGDKSGFMAGLRYRASEFYEVSLIGNGKSFVMGVAYSL